MPTSLQTGQAATVSVQMRNSGTTTWTSANGYRFGSQNPGDNATWGMGRVELSGSVAPGQTGTFTFTIHAPSAPGTYNFQWRMVREGVAWFGALSTNVAVQVTAPPTYGATFVSQTVPTSLQAGQAATVSVQMRNSGTTTWTSANGYRFGSQNPGDNATWGMGRVELSGSVAPGQTVTFTFTIHAPSAPGTYNFQWRMVREGVAWFGALSTNVAVQVTAPPTDGATFASQTVPTSLQTGQAATVSVQMRNSGTTIWTPADGYKLGSQNPADNAIWGTYREGLSGSVAPGQTGTFTFTIHAPSAPGTYNFQWRMQREGVAWFGASSINVAIQVTAPAPPVDPPPTTTTSYTQTETITYYDDTAKWVLGQVAKSVVDGVTVSETTYTANAQPATIKSFGKLQQTLTYNADGTVATAKDGNNNVTTLSSWKRGIPQSTTYADATTQAATVNDNGWITAVTDENGYKTSYTYDAMGRMASITYPTGDSTAWNTTTQVFEPVTAVEYGIPAGHWRQTVTTGNSKKLTYFDALWRPLVTREYDSANEAATKRFQRFTYDHDGRTTFASYPGATDALNTGTWTDYDALGRVTAVSQDSELGLLTTLTEYLSGFKTRVTDPKGNQTTTTYKAYDQPTYDWPVAIAHPGGAYTDITRDTFGKPLSIRRRNSDGSVSLTRSYAYNANQKLCRIDEPETGSTVMDYDGADNLVWSVSTGLNLGSPYDCQHVNAWNTGRVVSRTYDTRNRLATLRFPDSNGNQDWTYTADGLPAQVVTWNSEGASQVINQYSYNKRRLLAAERAAHTNMYDWTIGYDYDANGFLRWQSYPSGLVLDLAPNALGQPTRVDSYATGVSYYPNGAIKQFTYGNGIVHTLTQNARQLPSQSTDCTASGACATADKRLDLAYTFDGNGNVSHITDGVNGRQTRGMAYDGLDRLTQVTSNMFGTASYGYDVLDNLAHVQLTGGQARDQYYCYDSSWRLANVKTSSCTGTTVSGLGYDVQGNLANKNGTTYAFDYGNRLRKVSRGETWIESYRYDAQGRRAYAWDPARGYLLSQYARDGRLLYQRDERVAKQRDQIYLGNSLVAIREQPVAGGTVTVLYQHTDALGTPIAVTDANKALAQTSEYEPYGQLLNRTLTDGVGFTGHVQDAATGLTYMQQRYYDPQIGRFLSVDPVNVYSDPAAGFSRYWYGNNNPYRFSDPDGRQSKDLDGLFDEVLWTGIDSRNTQSTMSSRDRIVAGVFGGMDLAYGTVALSGQAFGALVGAASPADGPILDVAFGVATVKDGMQAVDGMRGVMSAMDGKQRPSTFEQAGGYFGGSEGAAVGKMFGTVLTFHGGAKALSNIDGTLEGFSDAVRPLVEEFYDPSKDPNILK